MYEKNVHYPQFKCFTTMKIRTHCSHNWLHTALTLNIVPAQSLDAFYKIKKECSLGNDGLAQNAQFHVYGSGSEELVLIFICVPFQHSKFCFDKSKYLRSTRIWFQKLMSRWNTRLRGENNSCLTNTQELWEPRIKIHFSYQSVVIFMNNKYLFYKEYYRQKIIINVDLLSSNIQKMVTENGNISLTIFWCNMNCEIKTVSSKHVQHHWRNPVNSAQQDRCIKTALDDQIRSKTTPAYTVMWTDNTQLFM